MSLGAQIAAARKAAKLTQAGLAEKLGVSAEAVSKWERDRYVPAPEKLALLREKLGLFLYRDDGSLQDLRFFDEEHMSACLKGRLSADRFPNASRALVFAKEKHMGAFRKPTEAKIPYAVHPITMTCHALAMGLEDDILLAALLLHDVAEDCGIAPREMPVSAEVQHIVALVTKPETGYSAEAYFDGIAEDPRACLVKCIDRCNNLSGMVAAFPPERVKKYIRETEEWYPRLLKIVKEQPAYNNAAWLLQYQIKSLLLTAKHGLQA